ncbi:TfoX C-terminal domain protein [Haemophilus pittmaniae HK 85]|uniref:TfoX C-terminal domain protein n=1 Tax=Haemophilus pittmaniae HK 85 TaxID=1035188 RepID=F9Q8B9_9PAST|nr:TfoX C-terminal domain protein [Haemophilus pittmaniae HK 85]
MKKVGINDVETLREHGAIQAMIMLKKAGIDATEDFYWKLVGALENRHFLSYSDEERQKKLDKFNECLAENGFRRCKKKKSKEDK